MPIQPNREQAWALLTEFNTSDALLKHALAVEAVMRYFARKMGEDEEKWGVIGLLHDLDYQRYPQEHCAKAAEILRERGIDEAYIHAIVSHGWGICSDVQPELPMEQVLYATDELTGLITAVAIMRPSKSLLDLTLKSVRKKYKSLNFAAGVDRSIIEKGAALLDVTVDSLIEDCIFAMREAAGALGLKGSL